MIDGGTMVSLVGIGGALVLVTAALKRRRLGKRPTLLLAATWIGIIVLLWAIASLGLRFGRAHFT